MIKKVIILFLIVLLVEGQSFAQSQFAPILSKMEKSLFGIDYNSQNDEARLKRIEEMVYGQPSTSPVNTRVQKLSKDLSADLIGQEIKPKRDSFEEEEQKYVASEPKEDASVSYPVVDKLEQIVFNNQNKSVAISKRLSSLEQKVFSRVYNDDLNSRVERLKAAVRMPSVAKSRDNYEYQDEYSDSSASSDLLSEYAPQDDFMQNNYSPKSYSNQKGVDSYNDNNSVLDSYDGDYSIGVPLSAMEQSILRKSYPNDSVSNRLSRLEGKVFNSSFDEDDPQTRLDRISSAHQAKKSSQKYDNNKFSQHMSAAMQIGAMLLMVLALVL